MSYGFQTANGMHYLEEKGVCHRDLAPRNVLINHNKIAKISDYGLAVACPYVKKIPEKLPTQILAPECLEAAHIYTSCSDVWAFGMFLWDIFNLCLEEPYVRWNASCAELRLRSLQQGQRLGIPKLATKTLYDLILSCWKLKPELRPTFANCRNYLEAELERCAPGYGENLKKRLNDEFTTAVMKNQVKNY